ncbi:MAG: dihydroorotase, partial [Spirochaetaceae bacterium]|nr:dihydroorotase [Spirochaetaceae bacterium]
LPVLERLLAAYPRLKIVLEHLSGREALAFVLAGPARLAGTLTAHHLLLSLEDLLGEGLSPHLYCKPLLKGEADRDALREAAFRGEGMLFFGSDSAPHARAAKESGRAPAGIYSSPAALPALAGLFERAGALGALGDFVAGRGAAFYGLPAPSGSLELVREAWEVPAEVDGAVPLLAGSRLPWRLGRLDRGSPGG